MPTNENTYNSRVTSEALEAKFRQVFPSQGGAELINDLYASSVIQPVIDFSSVAEGSVLGQNLQTAWDFSTGLDTLSGTGDFTVINTPGFWKVDWWYALRVDATTALVVNLFDGSTQKRIWRADSGVGTTNVGEFADEVSQIVYLHSGDSLRVSISGATSYRMSIWYRQIADISGNLVNPLGFAFT